MAIGSPTVPETPSYWMVPASLASAIGPLPFAARTRTFTVVVAGMFAATGSIVTVPVVADERT